MLTAMLRKLLLYLLGVGLPLAAVVAVLHLGAQSYGEPQQGTPAQAATPAQVVAPTGNGEAAGLASGALAPLATNFAHPLPLLLLQLVVVVLAARWTGALFRRWGQPAVIGEMLAGILLGPSLLGWLWPATQDVLFPEGSLAPLRLLSQLGVILFMFIVGIDLDAGHLRQRLSSAVWVSHASIVAPFLLGTLLALRLFPSLAGSGTSFVAFALFMGVAMSITAFPVLARILEERGLAATPLGAVAIACAAVDDVSAWCLLAAVVSIARAEAFSAAAVTLLLTLLFVGLMLGPVRRLAARLVPREVGGEAGARGLLAGVLSFLLLAAFATEVIGIHALFGAFLAGVALPRHPSILAYLRKRLEAFTAVFLLPLFFAVTGLRTQVGLLDDAAGWLAFLAVLAVAVAGKLGGSMLAARLAGMSWRDSFALGALMNTRGLVELIVLNLGYDLGILSPRVFVMMVLMALLTTFMTGPLLQVYERLRRRGGKAVPTSLAA